MNQTASDDDDLCQYGSCVWRPLSEAYDNVHTPLSFAICLFGTLSNIANIAVLTRKNLRTPVYMLLTGLSIAQLMLAANYFVLIILNYCRHLCHPTPWTKPFTTYRLANVTFNVILHTTAFCHTIAVAVFRYAALKWPVLASRHIYRPNLAIAVSVVIWCTVPVICLPVYFTSEIEEIPDSYRNALNCTSIDGPMYDLIYSDRPNFINLAFWQFGIVLKLLPSLILTLVMVGFIRSLKAVNRRRRTMIETKRGNHKVNASQLSMTGSNAEQTLRDTVVYVDDDRATICTPASLENMKKQKSPSKTPRQTLTKPRTTRMLVLVLLLCVAVELPHGVLNLLVAVIGADFATKVYDHLGSFMEMLTLLYSSINFILYCTMSNDFLQTFQQLFCPCRKQSSRTSSNCQSMAFTTPLLRSPGQCKKGSHLLKIIRSKKREENGAKHGHYGSSNTRQNGIRHHLEPNDSGDTHLTTNNTSSTCNDKPRESVISNASMVSDMICSHNSDDFL